MSETPDITYSFVAPVFNEADGLEHFHERLHAVAESLGEPYEILFVNDGSTDGSDEVLRRLASRDTHVKYLEFSRNFGHQAALSAGHDHAEGRAVVTLDSDCQHPPEVIPQLIERWKAGAEVVYTIRTDTEGIGRLKRWVIRCGYRVIGRASGMDLMDQADFRLLDRKVVLALRSIREQARFLRGLVRWVGFRQEAVSYRAEKRHAGRRTYTWRQTLRLAMAGLLNFSLVPLRAVAVTGGALLGAGLIYLLVGSILALVGRGSLSGLAVLLLCVGGLQLLGLAAVGEYVGRVHEEAKGRPLYIVREAHRFTE